MGHANKFQSNEDKGGGGTKECLATFLVISVFLAKHSIILIFDWNFREATSAHIFVVAPIFQFLEKMFVAGSVCNSRQTQEMNDKGAERYKRLSALGFKV